MRYAKYGWLEMLTTLALIASMWAAFFICMGFLARTAKTLFCFGFGC